MLGALLVSLRRLLNHFIARQMFGQLLVANFTRLSGSGSAAFLTRLEQFLGRILHALLNGIVLAKVELLLGWVFVPLAAMTQQAGQQLLNRQVQLFILLRELLTRRLNFCQSGGLFCDQRTTRGHLLQQRRCILHDRLWRERTQGFMCVPKKRKMVRTTQIADQTLAGHRLWSSVSTSLRRIELDAAEQESQLRDIELQPLRSLLVPRHLVIPAF